ncbi:MAG: lytic transglycosylase domain-containing protein [Bryobacteraceae bacterium]
MIKSNPTRTIATLAVLWTCIATASGTPAPKLQEAEYVQALQAELAHYPRVRPDMAAKLILVESRGQIEVADGSHGEIGAMQIRPQTFAYVTRNILHKKEGELNPRRHKDNLAVGVALINWLLKRYDHNESLALIGYNAGIGTADRARRKIARGEKARIPATTRAYLRTILGPSVSIGRTPQRPLQLRKNTAPRTLVALASALPSTVLAQKRIDAKRTLGSGPSHALGLIPLYVDRIEERFVVQAPQRRPQVRPGLVL